MARIDHLRGREIFPARYAWFLEGPWRRLLLSPKRLAQRLRLTPDLTVLEIGAGGGYYARPLSRLVRRFLALDIQAEMLQRLRRKPGGSGLLAVRADANDLPIREGSVDVVIAVTVLGEVPSAERTIAEVGRVLRRGGAFAVSEHWPDPDFQRLSRVEAWCRRHGFQLRNRYGTWFNYTAVLTSP